MAMKLVDLLGAQMVLTGAMLDIPKDELMVLTLADDLVMSLESFEVEKSVLKLAVLLVASMDA